MDAAQERKAREMRRKMLTVFVVGFVLMLPLAAVLQGASRTVQLAVWLPAVATVLGFYVAVAGLSVRASREIAAHGEKPAEDSAEVQRTRRVAGAILYVMPAYIFVSIAANIGSPARLALSFAVFIVGHLVLLWTQVVAALVLQRRRRRDGVKPQPRRAKPAPPGGPPW